MKSNNSYLIVSVHWMSHDAVLVFDILELSYFSATYLGFFVGFFFLVPFFPPPHKLNYFTDMLCSCRLSNSPQSHSGFLFD